MGRQNGKELAVRKGMSVGITENVEWINCGVLEWLKKIDRVHVDIIKLMSENCMVNQVLYRKVVQQV